MGLTPRRRAFLAVVVSLSLGYAYIFVSLHLVTDLARESRHDWVG